MTEHLDKIGFAELLKILQLDDDDRISLNIKIKHGKKWKWRCAGIGTPTEAIDTAADAGGRDLWFGVNPTSHTGRGRGLSAEVTRITAMIADFDDDKMSRAAQNEVIDDISELIGRASAIVESGHGRHVYWPDPQTGRRSAFQRRSGRAGQPFRAPAQKGRRAPARAARHRLGSGSGAAGARQHQLQIRSGARHRILR